MLVEQNTLKGGLIGFFSFTGDTSCCDTFNDFKTLEGQYNGLENEFWSKNAPVRILRLGKLPVFIK